MQGYITNNYSAFAESVENVLKCQGVCTACPHPEYETAEEQVLACWEPTAEQYNLDAGGFE